jgi:hypothetical protein
VTQLNSQEIKLGSSLKSLTNLITNETKIEKTNLGLWVENEIYIYELSLNLKILISDNYYPFGVLINESNNSYFLIDIDGDSVLDNQVTYLYVPHWVIALNSAEKNNNSNIISIFDMYYRAYQNNNHIKNSELILDGAREIIKAGQDIFYTNRDILYLFYIYDRLYISKEYQLCLKYLSYLDNEIHSRFKERTHVIIFIYLVETLYKLKRYKDAAEINNILLGNYPGCIPGLVYQVLLESDLDKRSELKSNLINTYGDHWLVKEKI